MQWLSQTIFSHKDREYGTNGYMRVSMSTQTKDSQSFTAPNFTINIQNEGINKTVSLPYQKLFEIYGRLQEAVKSAIEEYSSKSGNPETQLHFKTGKSTYIDFEFMRGSQQNEPVVRITISHGTSNSTKIVLPFSPEFHSFISLIGDMISNKKYLDWCLHFPNRFFFVEMNEVLKQMPGIVKSAVVQIDNLKEEPPTPSTPPTEPSPEVDSSNTNEASNMMQELDAFVGDGMKNIEMEMPVKLEVEKTVVKEVVNNKLIEYFKGDIRNFESMVLRCSEKPSPIRQFEKEFSEIYPDIDCFPGIGKKEMKSLVYLTGREFLLYNFQANTESIKRSFSINKYKGFKHAKPSNMELAYDLLTLSIFCKICRDRIENKTSDNYLNKTFLHLAIALNISPFIFSFITSDTQLSTIIRDRYREMENVGLFNDYKGKEFKTYDFDVTERDIVEAVSDITEKYLKSKTSDVDSYMRHVLLYKGGSCILNPDNQLNEEQIINQAVSFEMHVLMNNKNIQTDKKELLAYASEKNMEEEVITLFIKTAPKKNIPIVKFFEDNMSEIPEDSRQEFMARLSEYNNRDYDLSDNKFPYDSFGEQAIKALFLWKPESGEKFRTYKKFNKAIIKSVHDKQTILSMITHDSDAGGESFAEFYSQATGKGK